MLQISCRHDSLLTALDALDYASYVCVYAGIAHRPYIHVAPSGQAPELKVLFVRVLKNARTFAGRLQPTAGLF